MVTVFLSIEKKHLDLFADRGNRTWDTHRAGQRAVQLLLRMVLQFFAIFVELFSQ